MMILTVTGLSAAIVVGRWRLAVVTTAFFLLFAAPLLAVAGLLGLGIWGLVKLVARPKAAEDDDALLAELVALGLTAGLTFPAAVEAATAAVPGESSAELRRASRTFRDDDGSLSDDPGLLLVARRALSTGAPLLPAVSGYATAIRDAERSRRLVAARRLPVKLLFPLALLILPGFLILTVGPALLGSLERLGL